MSIIQKMTKTSLVLLGLVAFSTACKKELRTMRYDMGTYNNSGVTGYVEFKEKSDGTTTIHVHMMGTRDSLVYPAHIHNGAISSPGGVAIDLGTFSSSGMMSSKDVESDMDYDDMINFNGCFVAHDPAAADPLTSYVLVGNIGSNAQ